MSERRSEGAMERNVIEFETECHFQQISGTQWAKRVWELGGAYVDQGKGKNLLITYSVVV